MQSSQNGRPRFLIKKTAILSCRIILTSGASSGATARRACCRPSPPHIYHHHSKTTFPHHSHSHAFCTFSKTSPQSAHTLAHTLTPRKLPRGLVLREPARLEDTSLSLVSISHQQHLAVINSSLVAIHELDRGMAPAVSIYAGARILKLDFSSPRRHSSRPSAPSRRTSPQSGAHARGTR